MHRYPELAARLAAEAGFVINITEAPPFVYEKAKAYESKAGDADEYHITECIYAVGLGYLDFCVVQVHLRHIFPRPPPTSPLPPRLYLDSGVVQTDITQERSRLADFYVIEALPMYLIVAAETSSPSFTDMMENVLKPFEWRVWVTMLAAVLVFSAIFALQEAYVADSQFEDADDKPVLLGRTLWLGLDGLAGFARAHDPAASVGGRITGWGLAFFFFLLATSCGPISA